MTWNKMQSVLVQRQIYELALCMLSRAHWSAGEGQFHTLGGWHRREWKCQRVEPPILAARLVSIICLTDPAEDPPTTSLHVCQGHTLYSLMKLSFIESVRGSYVLMSTGGSLLSQSKVQRLWKIWKLERVISEMNSAVTSEMYPKIIKT